MPNEHPFAQYIRILGKGHSGYRDLTRTEACDAMNQILANEVEDVQLGAFLMLLRIKEESPKEIAGFIDSIHASLFSNLTELNVDLDWPTYAGKRRHLPWFILSALLLAQNGIRVFMHGAAGHTAGRIYTHEVLERLGLPVCQSFDEAGQRINDTNFAYLPLSKMAPLLHKIIELRPLLGLRSPIHTICRMLNPYRANFLVQGIFHPDYRDLHQHAGQLLGQQHLAAFKGEGGEAEINPERPCLVKSVHDDELTEEEWPTILEGSRQQTDPTLNPGALARLWHGELTDDYAVSAVVGTTAIMLRLLQRADSKEQAMLVAEQYWQNRNSSLIRLTG